MRAATTNPVRIPAAIGLNARLKAPRGATCSPAAGGRQLATKPAPPRHLRQPARHVRMGSYARRPCTLERCAPPHRAP